MGGSLKVWSLGQEPFPATLNYRNDNRSEQRYESHTPTRGGESALPPK